MSAARTDDPAHTGYSATRCLASGRIELWRDGRHLASLAPDTSNAQIDAFIRIYEIGLQHGTKIGRRSLADDLRLHLGAK